MNKHFLFIAVIVMAMTVPFASAKQIGPLQALEIARQFSTTDTKLKSAVPASPAQMQVVYTASSQSGKAAADGENGLLYVVDRGDNAGYVMVAGDDVVVNPVLGYSAAGEFDYDKAPDNLRWWIGEYVRLIEYAAAHGMTVAATPTFDTSLDPLITTHWNQDAPYNDLCPWLDEGYRAYTGCVATAMAQVMNYHEWPVQGTGSHTYTDVKGCGQTLSANFGNTTYRWDLMRNDYVDGSWTAEEAEAVATLMYHCGVAVDMMYMPDASGAYSHDVPAALVNYFGYAKDIIHRDRDYYTQSEWIEMMKADLDAGRPVYYHGQSTGGGHAFVIDGYNTDGYFHVNWGWGGLSDEYYQLATLDPYSGQGIGGAISGFAYSQGAIFNMHRPTGNETETPDFRMRGLYLYGGGTSVETTKGKEVIFQLNQIWNYHPTASFGGYFGIAIEDDNGEVVASSYEVIDEVPPTYGYTEFYIGVTITDDIADGHYRAYPFYAADMEGERFPIKAQTLLSGYADVEVAGDNVTVTLQETMLGSISCSGVAVVINDTFTNGEEARVYAQITNNGTEYYNSMVSFGLCKHNSLETVYGPDYTTDVSIAPGEMQTVKISQTVAGFYPEEDVYDIVIFDQNLGALPGARSSININNPDLTLTEELRITDPNPANLTLTATVKNPSTSTTYNGNICALIWKPYPEQGLMVMQKALDIQNVEIAPGETIDLTLKGSFTEGVIGDTYNISLFDDSQALTSYMDLEYVPGAAQEVAEIEIAGEPEITNEDPDNLTVSMKLENTASAAAYDGTVSVAVYDVYEKLCGDLGSQRVQLQAGATSETITFTGAMNEMIWGKTYMIRITDDYNGRQLATVDYVLDGPSVSFVDDLQIVNADPASLTVAATLQNTSPWFDYYSYMNITIFNADQSEIVATIGEQTVEIPAGESKRVELTGSFDDCVRGETYYLYMGLGYGVVLPGYVEYVFTPSGIVDNFADGGTRLYPNPVGNVLNVVDGRGIDRVQVLGLTGSQVLDVATGGDTVAAIDMAGLPAGTYIVRIVTTDGSATMQKIIKK